MWLDPGDTKQVLQVNDWIDIDEVVLDNGAREHAMDSEDPREHRGRTLWGNIMGDMMGKH